ncbi:MAG: hypothetical protein J6N15_12645 [Ruminiclostridium sp.]|nr:hypothetical protein [Ruminiclostridium sp.]
MAYIDVVLAALALFVIALLAFIFLLIIEKWYKKTYRTKPPNSSKKHLGEHTDTKSTSVIKIDLKASFRKSPKEEQDEML